MDKQREKRVRTYIIIVAVLTMCPAIYLTIDMIKGAFFESAANRFIAEQLSFDNTQVINKKIDHDKKEIRVALIGPEVSDEQLNAVREKMDKYKLKDTKLTVMQGMNNKEMDVSTVRAMIMEDFYKNSEARLKEQSEKIGELEQQLRVFEQYDEITSIIAPEMKALYPSVTSVALSRMLEVQIDSMKIDTIALALLSFDKKPKQQEIDKINEWLKARLRIKNVKLVVE